MKTIRNRIFNDSVYAREINDIIFDSCQFINTFSTDCLIMTNCQFKNCLFVNCNSSIISTSYISENRFNYCSFIGCRVEPRSTKFFDNWLDCCYLLNCYIPTIYDNEVNNLFGDYYLSCPEE